MLKYFGDGVSVTVDVAAAEKMCLLQRVLPDMLSGLTSMITPGSAGTAFSVDPQTFWPMSLAVRVRRVPWILTPFA